MLTSLYSHAFLLRNQKIGFAIIFVYVYDLNHIGTPEELTRTKNYLKREFEIKDLIKTKFCLRLQIEHFPTGILVHQSAYTKKILKFFYMNEAHPLTSPMVVRSLDVRKDPFRPCEKDEELVTPRIDEMPSTCNCKGAYVHQVPL